MPCNYKKDYSPNWHSEIRPAILERANNCCEQCGVKNKEAIIRGRYNDKDVYQDMDGTIWDANNPWRVGDDYIGSIDSDMKNKIITIVLTVAHLDNDTSNNDYSNLKALCQRCHLRMDSGLHRKNSRQTRNNKKGLQDIFEQQTIS